MRFSIITVCWNSVATIRDAMASVVAQRLEKVGGERGKEKVGGERGEEKVGGESRWRADDQLSLEYIVVDGGSTDGTVEAIKEFSDEVEKVGGESRGSGFSFKWISEKDNGMYDAMNKGIRMATGDVIGVLNADDVLDGDQIVVKIAQQFEVVSGQSFDTNNQQLTTNNLDCVYGKVRFVNELGGKTVRRCFAKLWRPWMLQWGYMPPHPGIFIRRECFEKWGGYVGDRKEYIIAADYELLIRFFRVHKMRAVYSGLCTTVMRTGGVSTKNVNARRLLNQEIIKGNRANGYFCCWPMLLPKYAVKVWEVILPRLGLVG